MSNFKSQKWFISPHYSHPNAIHGRALSCSYPNALAIWRYRSVVFRTKMGWLLEHWRLWAILSQRVYRNPRTTYISGVMRRLREEVRNTDPKTLTRLVHELPAKMNEIYRLKGKKISGNFAPRKSPHACKCSVCESWEFICSIVEWIIFEIYSLTLKSSHQIFKNPYTFLKMNIACSMQKIV